MIITLKAILKDNKIYCPKCESHKYQLTDDYKSVEIKSIKYTKFVARCLACGGKFYFFSRINMDSHTHHIFSEDDEVEIKE